MYIRLYVCMYGCMYACMCVRMYVCTYVSRYVFVRLCMLYVCIHSKNGCTHGRLRDQLFSMRRGPTKARELLLPSS